MTADRRSLAAVPPGGPEFPDLSDLLTIDEFDGVMRALEFIVNSSTAQAFSLDDPDDRARLVRLLQRQLGSLV